MTAKELDLWEGALSGFSLAEVQAAIDELIMHPPKYELDATDNDGRPIVQTWRGMPKLPDVVQTILAMREKKAAELRRTHEWKPDPGCPKCNGEGFKEIFTPATYANEAERKRHEVGKNRVGIVQCDCRQLKPRSVPLPTPELILPPGQERIECLPPAPEKPFELLREVLKVGMVEAYQAEPEPSVGISLMLDDGTEYALTQTDINLAKSLYPAMDVMEHYRKLSTKLAAEPFFRRSRGKLQESMLRWIEWAAQNHGIERAPQDLDLSNVKNRVNQLMDELDRKTRFPGSVRKTA